MRFAVLSTIVANTLLASNAFATVPDPSKCTLGVNLPSAMRPYISLEGATSGQPDNCSDGRCSNYTIEVRDALNNPIPTASVVIDFASCTDMQIACDQLTGITGQSYLDPSKVVGSTDAIGRFR